MRADYVIPNRNVRGVLNNVTNWKSESGVEFPLELFITMTSKAAKKKQNLEMYDALESTIKRVTDQAQRFRRKMDELVRNVFLFFCI